MEHLNELTNFKILTIKKRSVYFWLFSHFEYDDKYSVYIAKVWEIYNQTCEKEYQITLRSFYPALKKLAIDRQRVGVGIHLIKKKKSYIIDNMKF